MAPRFWPRLRDHATRFQYRAITAHVQSFALVSSPHQSWASVLLHGRTQSTSRARVVAETFSLANIPFQSFVDITSRIPESFNLLSPRQYYEAAKKFVAAIQSSSNPLVVSTHRLPGLSVEVIHDLGCIMRHIQGSRSANALAVAMWASASELGFRPATLSLARHLIRSNAFGRQSSLAKVESRFKQLVKVGKDPNALTAEGEQLFALGKFEAAANILQRALRLGSADFPWKPHCELCLARAYLQVGRVADATSLLEALATSGLPEADFELGKLLKASDPDRAERHLYTAGCHGFRDAFVYLSESALERAAQNSKDAKAARDNERLATELSRLADPHAKL